MTSVLALVVIAVPAVTAIALAPEIAPLVERLRFLVTRRFRTVPAPSAAPPAAAAARPVPRHNGRHAAAEPRHRPSAPPLPMTRPYYQPRSDDEIDTPLLY